MSVLSFVQILFGWPDKPDNPPGQKILWLDEFKKAYSTMVSNELLNQVKAVPIADFLASRGILPVEQEGGQLLYHSPLRNDQTATSFWVHLAKNAFKDFVIPEHRGDVIRLVQLLDGCDFVTAIQKLQSWQNQTDKSIFSLSGQTTDRITAAKGKDQVKAVKLLANKQLVRYVESRGISYPIARTYLREVYYSHKEFNLYSLGFANDKEGYALRNEWTDRVGEKHSVKRNIGPAWYSTITGKQADIVNVFEGFFDFLSALAYYNQLTPGCTTIILNSASNLEVALPVLQSYTRVNAYLDQDETGLTTLAKLKSHCIQVVDRSVIYQGHKDFNAYWQAYTAKPSL